MMVKCLIISVDANKLANMTRLVGFLRGFFFSYSDIGTANAS